MTSWQAPKRVRRFQSMYRDVQGVRRLGKMHVGAYIQFTYYGRFRAWGPACATAEQVRKWSLRGPQGRALTAGATAPINCAKCIQKVRDQ